MKLLALETATEACSVALHLDGEIIERHQIAPRRHAELTLPWIDELLSEAGLVRTQLDAIACSRGPGAFTGVRLAVAITQGLALALERPAIGVSTLHALALPAMRRLEEAQADLRLVSAIDARMGEVYLAEYVRDDAQNWQQQGDERVLAPTNFALVYDGPCHGVGTGFAAEHGALTHCLGERLIHVDATALPRARDVAHLALIAFARGEASAPEALQPAYLRNQVALTLRQQGKPVPSLPADLERPAS
ncbi:MAG TPA: tRNA (adenosine(37)-N6)-threonylcarbamoyltransferase complex dimerization subunit type 1 TsaB [Chiayiivirga sp.]|nr:tRNA (adenosine(37)-N6)-threonylcarbamoyltransferase complex dimerization subunit type 1 TsaB [Chiayiivirga sp.]